MSNIWVILGAGDLFADLYDAILSQGDALKCVVTNQVLGEKIRNKIKVPTIELDKYHPDSRDLHLFGFLNPNKEKFIEAIGSIQFGNLIHKYAYLAREVNLGKGNYIGPMVTIAPNTQIGDFNYFNRNSSIGHDVTIKNFNHFGPSATICGNCRIGNKNYFGANSTVIDNKTVMNEVTIGAGSLIREDLKESGTYVGVPAKKLLQSM